MVGPAAGNDLMSCALVKATFKKKEEIIKTE